MTMLAIGRLAALTFLLLAAIYAAPAQASSACISHILQAERHYGIPPKLLMAIALTESGREGLPHPWTLNVAGAPGYYSSFEQAALELVKSRKKTRNIDVGCMQVNLRWHEKGDPRAMLIPRNNVWYAASFLSDLRDRHGSWTRAVGRYHAGANNHSAQRAYICRVWVNWQKLRGHPSSRSCSA